MRQRIRGEGRAHASSPGRPLDVEQLAEGDYGIVNVADAAIARPASPKKSPIFMHFAMCGKDTDNNSLAAPLSWVLSSEAQNDIKDMLKNCQDNQSVFDNFGAIIGLK